MSSKSFLDLEVWQKSHDCVLGIYQISAKFPKEELFGLTSQLRRAAISVPANISEGFKRTGVKDKIRFYNIAQASLEEVRYYLILARDLCYLDSDQNLEEANEIGKMLESYVRKIKENHTTVKF
ncbi:MAG: four helix bundle protein [Bacteroidales bacterium]|nr:four helix bundle protein [Bacteroidales bacterium]MCF8344159.1 four helix bundle protein [Bacteroidales bacterium]MCF8351132.1 four helix bundle protein [Bacteroidales bacterium]MCF8374806.1 four helix bundle protein [Bacteroidales bacterium]MCF8399790.1 four helix bundle protein [Bacteroidales bacterium]